MIKLNPFGISGLLIAAAYLPTSVFIFICGRNKLAKLYSLHLFSVCLWGIGAFLIASSSNEKQAHVYWIFSYLSAVFIPVFFLHAVQVTTKQINRPLILFAYFQAILFSYLVKNDYTLSSFKFLFNSFFYYQGNFLYFISFLVWAFLASFAHIQLMVDFKKNFPEQKKEIIFLFLSIIGFVGGTMNFLPALGIYIYPYGNFVIPLHSFIVSYAIFKHKLFEIEIAFKKGLIYSLLLTIILIFYLISVILSEKLIQHSFGYNSELISIAMAFAVGIILIPLRNRIQDYVDKLLFQTSHMELINQRNKFEQEIRQTEKLKSIAIFASGIAHEVRNPLTAIKTFCEYLPNKVNDQEFINKFVPIVNKEVDRINELVKDLLEYAKPSPLILKQTDVPKLIHDTLDLLNSQIITKRINVVREIDAPAPHSILLDSNQIKQALLNIFINAIDALQPNGYLRVTLETSDHKLIIKITDTGSGIAKEDLPHIFDPFFTKKENGTGLGLSITHGIIKEHGGRIFVESKVGRGTTFRIELPVKKET